MNFSDDLDHIEMGSSGGSFANPAVFTLTFDAGDGLTRLSDVSLNTPSGAGFGAPVTFLTESGSVFSTNGVFNGEITGIRFLVGATLTLASISGTPTCFGHGTRIATPSGATEVQDLGIGDTVLTADGETRDVLWVGRQSFDMREGLAEHLRPVRIRAGALGDNLPARDLVITADHALFLEGVLVNASALVNGTSVTFDGTAEVGRRHTVYHVETEDHALILAEGVAAETFIDAAGRKQFDNYAQYVRLYGADRAISESNIPRISSQRLVPYGLRVRLGLDLAA